MWLLQQRLSRRSLTDKLVPENTNTWKTDLTMWKRESKRSTDFAGWFRRRRAGMDSLLDWKWTGIPLKPTWTYRSFLKKPHENGSLAMANAGHVTKTLLEEETQSYSQYQATPPEATVRMLPRWNIWEGVGRGVRARRDAARRRRRRWEARRLRAVMRSGAVRQPERKPSKTFTSAFPTWLSCGPVFYHGGVKCSKGSISCYHYQICLRVYFCSWKPFL